MSDYPPGCPPLPGEEPDFTESDDRSLAEWLGLPVAFGCDEHVDVDSRVVYPAVHQPIGYLTAPTPDSDYRVLVAVRRKADIDLEIKVRNILDESWQWNGETCGVFGCTRYRVGDYARAAYAAKQETDDE